MAEFETVSTEPLSTEPARLSNAYQNWYRFSRNPTAVIGAAIVVICILAALLAPYITPYPDHVGAVVNFRARHQPPSAEFWFGTDNVGRDIFTRTVYGMRISLLLALVVLGTAVPIGTILGILAGYFGGWVEVLIMRVTDIALAIPPLVNRVLAITKMTALGSAIGVSEILSSATTAQSFSGSATPLTMSVAAYLVIFLPMVVVARWLESRTAWKKR